MKQPLRVLVVEDSEFDAKMLVRLLDRGGYATAYERVQTADDMARALTDQEWDLVLSDYNLPGFNVEVIDPVSTYAGLMRELFDFDAIRALFASGFRLRYDAMNAVGGKVSNIMANISNTLG